MDYNEKWFNGINTHDNVEQAIKQKVQELQQGIDNADSEAARKYAKPATGIPKADLAQAVRTSLEKADNAVQKVDGKGLSTNDFTTAEKNKLAGLSNYDDSELQKRVGDIEDALEGLPEPGEGSVSSVTINGEVVTPDAQGNVDLGEVKGQRGPTGNVRVDGVGNVLIINNLEDGGTDAALSAEMGKRIAIGSGNFAKAWAHSKAIPFPFMWVWSELVNGVTITKPIWHKGNSEFVDVMGSTIYVQAASKPGVPTMTGATAGATVAKNTPITIKPVADAAVLYTLDNWVTTLANDMDAVVRLTTSGEVTVKAKCVNTAGDSQEVSWSFTVQSTAITESDTEEGEVPRGQQVKITAEHELHYSTDGGTTWTTATDDNGKSATFTIDGGTQAQPMQIKAYDKDGNETGTVATYEYWMEALMAPEFSKESGTVLSAYGDDIELTAPGALHIYYTLDGSTPTSSSTEYTGEIHVGTALTIKAIAVDDYGTSAVATATYDLKPMAIYVKTTDATVTMSLGDTDLDQIALDDADGENYITLEDINDALGLTGSSRYSSFADHEFASLSFSDNTKVIEFDGCGLKVKSLDSAFYMASALTKAVGIVISNTQNGVNVGGNCTKAFCKAYNTAEIEVSGVVSTATSMFDMTNGAGGITVVPQNLNIRNLSFKADGGVGVGFMLRTVNTSVLDMQSLDFTKASGGNMIFVGCSATTWKVGGGFSFNYVPSSSFPSVVTTVIISSDTPPSLATCDWVDKIGAAHLTIRVPDAAKETYQQIWSNYSTIIFGISETV